MTIRLLVGHVLDRLAEQPDESVHCVVSSPPYYGLRDYGNEPQTWGGDPGCGHEWGDERQKIVAISDKRAPEHNTERDSLMDGTLASQGTFCLRCNAWRGSLGLEPTPALYVDHMVAVFREVRRVLRADGTLWLNIGDSYATSNPAGRRDSGKGTNGKFGDHEIAGSFAASTRQNTGLKPKDLLGMPWMLAFVLRADGWYLRSEITWGKRAPMPESVTDRPTSATEKVFLLTKSARYFYDAEAVKEEAEPSLYTTGEANGKDYHDGRTKSFHAYKPSKRNMRNWWLLGPEPFPEAHFATFPTEIPRRAILAGTSERGVCLKCGAPWERVIKKTAATVYSRASEYGHGAGRNDGGRSQLIGAEAKTIGWRPSCSCVAGEPVTATVLDPFGGAGTTGLVADQLQRNAILIDINPTYAAMAERRIRDDAPLFAQIAAE
jgi:DNA modification methylase